MFWVYIPPIIFIAALIALVVIFGKKTSRLRKTGAFRRKEDQFEIKGRGSERFKKIWKHSLNLLEWVIRFAKIGIKKSELGLSGALHKIKEKRLGRKIPKTLPDEFQSKPEDHRDSLDIIQSARKKKESGREKVLSADVDFLRNEVIVRKKEEPVPQRIMPDLAPEDKVREDALIHRIAENPKDVEAYRELGDYYLSVGNIKDAKDSFKIVLKLRPRDLKAKSSLREIEMKIRLGS